MYKSSFDCIRCILRDEGFRGFYRGLPANMLRSFAGALMLVLVCSYILSCHFVVLQGLLSSYTHTCATAFSIIFFTTTGR